MTAEAKQTGKEADSGLGWAQRSLVCSLLGFFVGAGGVTGALLLVVGILAVACGLIGLRRIPKSQSPTYAKWMAAAGIVFGCLLMFVGLDQLFTPNRAITKAKKVTSLATAIAIESAVDNIYTEYGKIPSVGNIVTTKSPEGLKLLNILLGHDAKSDNALNSRAIKFLSVKEGKNNKNGLVFTVDGKSVQGLYDPWGNPYTVVLDTEYTDELHFTMSGKSVDLKGRRVAVFSPGRDMKLGTADDVKTW